MTSNNSINTDQQIIQVQYNQSNSTVTLNDIIPYDDTIPQNTEGVEVITQDITPTSATSILLIEFSCLFTSRVAPTNTNNVSSALFQDSAVDALAAVASRPKTSDTEDGGASMNLIYAMTSGTTSSTTFKIRMGPTLSGNSYVNADAAGTRLMGGVAYATLSITEFHQG